MWDNLSDTFICHLPNKFTGLTLKNTFTLKGKVHNTRIQCVHLCVCITVHAVEIIRQFAGLLAEGTVGKVGDCMERRCLGRGRGHRSQAGLGLELGLELVVLVHG